jgi:hypothetical protein
MKLIDKVITSEEGYILKWHAVHDVLVDIDAKVMTLTVGSWLVGEMPEHGKPPLTVSSIEVYFEVWNEGMLLNTFNMLTQTSPWSGGLIVETEEKV